MRRQGVRDLAAWRSLVSESDLSKTYERFQDLCREVKSSHIAELIAMRDGTDDIERRWGFSVLAELAATNDARLLPRVREAVVENLRQVARAEYLRTPYGDGAWHCLNRLSRDEGRAVIEAQDVISLTDEERKRLVDDIGLTSLSERTLEQLRVAKGLGGEAGRAAERRLEGLGFADMRKIRPLARKWRESRDARALKELYLRYLVPMQGKITIAEIVKLVGRPDKRSGHLIWYVPGEWSSLSLQGDSKGVLRALKFTD